MAELKTKQNDGDVKAFLESVEDEKKRAEGFVLLKLFIKATNEEARMWGKSIVGFGSYHYKYASGREGDWMATGFSPRKQNISLYIMDGFENHQEILDRLGKHKLGKGCLYIKKLEDVDLEILEGLIKKSFKAMKSL